MTIRSKFNPFTLPRHRRHVYFNTDPASGGAGGGGAPATGGGDLAPAAPATGGDPAPAAGTPPAADPKAGATPPPAADDWRKDWAPELRDDPSLKDFKDPQAIAKALVETKKMVGAKPLSRPDANATQEQKDAFTKQLRDLNGVPTDIKEYGLAKPSDLPPEMDALYSDEGLAAFGTLAHNLGFNKEQVAGLQKFDMERAQAQLQLAQQAAQQRETAFLADFTKIHGANANAVLDRAGALIDATGRKEDAATIAGAPEAVRKAVANILSTVDKQYIGEGKLPGQGTGGATKSLAELQADLKTTIAKPEYRDPFSPEHKATIAAANDISKQIALLQQK